MAGTSGSGPDDPHRREKYISREDLIFQTEERVAHQGNFTTFLCPCKKSKGGHRYSIQAIKKHLRENGRNQMLMKSMVGGDHPGGYPSAGVWENNGKDYFNAQNVYDNAEEETEYEEHLDPFHDIQQQLFDAFDVGDNLRQDVTDEEYDSDDADGKGIKKLTSKLDQLEDLRRHATQPVHEGVNVSIVSVTIVLINMAMIHAVSNAYMDELLNYVLTVLLPRGNKLPRSYNEAKRLVKRLGLNYNIIHCCRNGCMLFRKELEHATVCPNRDYGALDIFLVQIVFLQD